MKLHEAADVGIVAVSSGNRVAVSVIAGNNCDSRLERSLTCCVMTHAEGQAYGTSTDTPA